MASTTSSASLSALMWYPSISSDIMARKPEENGIAFLPFRYQQPYATYLLPTAGVRPEPFCSGHYADSTSVSTETSAFDCPGSRPKVTDPFAPECIIPLPSIHGDEMFYYEPVFLRRRNERERQRVRCVNESYNRLRSRLPVFLTQKRMSKVEILRSAIAYIRYLQASLDGSSQTGQALSAEPETKSNTK